MQKKNKPKPVKNNGKKGAIGIMVVVTKKKPKSKKGYSRG